MGGSPSALCSGRCSQRASTAAPAPRATAPGTRYFGAGTPTAAQIPATISATVRGSPFVTT